MRHEPGTPSSGTPRKSFHGSSAVETPVLFIYLMLSYHQPNSLVRIFCSVKANGVEFECNIASHM